MFENLLNIISKNKDEFQKLGPFWMTVVVSRFCRIRVTPDLKNLGKPAEFLARVFSLLNEFIQLHQ